MEKSKKLYIAGVIIFFCIALVLFLKAILVSPSFTIAQKRAVILETVTVGQKAPLSEMQKKELFASLKGNQVNDYGFSDQEIAAILKTLNQ